MQCDEINIEVAQQKLNELDKALKELGMLATRTNSREEYLNEIHHRSNPYLNMLTINTRYVSNVSIGFRLRPVAPQLRYKPYSLPKERYRTKSENNDNETTEFVQSLVDNCFDNTIEEVSQLKKAKSLESILTENNQNLKDINIECFPELEIVSDCIQNLRVVE